uniref:SGNH hydrolase-type esterase domain-containing protein n=1 Tax=Gopherus evgoodei TaxID=1825980 RepID=A0A8C4YP06_9SAUR
MMEHRHEGAEGISSAVQMEAGPKNSEERLLGEDSGQCKHVTKRTRQRKRRASEGEIELRKRFAELENEEGAQQVVAEGERTRKKRRADSPTRGGEESMEATPNISPRRIARVNRNREVLQPVGAEGRPENHTVTRKRQVYVTGDSLLRRIDRPVTRADQENRRVCCLPGAKIQDVDLRLKRILVRKNPLIVLHVGTTDLARFSLERMKGEYARLGKTLKEIEARVIFSGILPVPREGQQRCDKIIAINRWLRQWCYREDFGMYCHWEAFTDRRLFSRDGLHLSKEGNRLLGWKLAQLIRVFKLGIWGRWLGDVQVISRLEFNLEREVNKVKGDTAMDRRIDIRRKGSVDTKLTGDTGGRMSMPNRVKNVSEPKRQKIKCLYTNARSLGNKMEELVLLMQELKLDIIGITETWWNSSHDWSIGIEGYVLFRKDRNKGKGGGGVALYINDEVNCKEISDGMDKT